MFKASNVLPAFATALLCTVWMILAPMAGIPGWSGFAGRVHRVLRSARQRH